MAAAAYLAAIRTATRILAHENERREKGDLQPVAMV
jgi:hypothetical protein